MSLNLPTSLSSTELLDRVKKALTPEQYSRMQDKAIDKIGIMQLSSMNLENLKSELPTLVHDDPEKQDILARLEVEFPWIQNPKENSQTPKAPTFTEHPWDWAKNTLQERETRLYEAVVPDRIQEASKMNKEWASTMAIATTVVAWVSAGKTIQSAEKTVNWFEKLRNDPGKFFKELFDTLLSFDINRIKSFFESNIHSFGITSSMADEFGSILGISKDTIKSAKTLFLLENFGNMSYGELGKIWEKYQKNPDLDLMKLFQIKTGSSSEIAKVLESIFWKNAQDLTDRFLQKSGTKEGLSSISMRDFLTWLR